jgi:hypothetical protein
LKRFALDGKRMADETVSPSPVEHDGLAAFRIARQAAEWLRDGIAAYFIREQRPLSGPDADRDPI